MKISVTSGKKMSNKFVLLKSNQFFLKNRKKGDLFSIIPVEEYGFIVRINRRQVSFDIYKKVEKQEEKICDFIKTVYDNRLVCIESTEPCTWIKNIGNVNIVEL